VIADVTSHKQVLTIHGRSRLWESDCAPFQHLYHANVLTERMMLSHNGILIFLILF
jgi:hypothetical protein